MKHSFSFLLVSDSWHCMLYTLIAILNWMHEDAYSNTIIVIYTVILYKIPYLLQNLCTAQWQPNIMPVVSSFIEAGYH